MPKIRAMEGGEGMTQVKLFPHQERALKATEGLQRVAYYLDMGLGKTFVGSEKAVTFRQKILLVCQHSKIQDWIEHFNDHYSLPVFNLTVKEQLSGFVAGDGQAVGVINYELIFRRNALKQMQDFTLMLDESSLIQNETAKRSKFILGLKPSNVILLSGTPTDGKYERLWSQLHLLGWHITKETFWQHYIETEWIDTGDDSGFKRRIVTGYKNTDRLKAKMAQYGCVFMKSDEAFTLPQQQEIPIMVPTSKEYRTFMYSHLITVNVLDVAVTGWKTGILKELVGDTSLTSRLYARQLCGMYSIAKLEAFRDLIESTNDRLIVFYNFTGELKAMLPIALQKTSHISFVNGSTKDLQDYFLYEDSITFVQYQAGAMGLNLQKANKIVYYTLPEKSEYLEQSKKRIHRIGQEKTCFYYYLLCRNSVELDILENLKMRKDYTDELFKKKYQPQG